MSTMPVVTVKVPSRGMGRIYFYFGFRKTMRYLVFYKRQGILSCSEQGSRRGLLPFIKGSKPPKPPKGSFHFVLLALKLSTHNI